MVIAEIIFISIYKVVSQLPAVRHSPLPHDSGEYVASTTTTEIELSMLEALMQDVIATFYEVVFVKLQTRRRVNVPGRWIGLAILEIGKTTIHPASIFCS